MLFLPPALSGNRRNGYTPKQIRIPLGEVTAHTPRDRKSIIESEFIKKRERVLAKGVADRIIGLYALGNSTHQLSDRMEENLGNRVSAEPISSITDRVLPEIQAWRSRPLESVYAIVKATKTYWVCTSPKAKEPIFGSLVCQTYSHEV